MTVAVVMISCSPISDGVIGPDGPRVIWSRLNAPPLSPYCCRNRSMWLCRSCAV